jgi:DNA-binding Lrp family transcriptional regulator
VGRTAKAIDTDMLLDLLGEGVPRKDIADIFGVSAPTISNKIEELRKEESTLLAYEKNIHLDLIGVQQRCLSGVTIEKVADAPLGQIASMFSAANKAMQLAQGRPTEIHGLMGYLLHLEKEDIEAKQKTIADGNVVDITSEGDNGDEQ